jgi:UDP-N-acetylglucosamine 2-epimerase (non-hydrolysing)
VIILSFCERPVTVKQGTNRLCKIDSVESCVDEVLKDRRGKTTPPELWDGQTAESVGASVKRFLTNDEKRII